MFEAEHPTLPQLREDSVEHNVVHYEPRAQMREPGDFNPEHLDDSVPRAPLIQEMPLFWIMRVLGE